MSVSASLVQADRAIGFEKPAGAFPENRTPKGVGSFPTGTGGSLIPWRFDRLLTCPEPEIGSAALRIIDRLQGIDRANRLKFLRLLAAKTKKSPVPIKHIKNRVASIELLTIMEYPATADILETAFDWPIGEHTLYLISLANTLVYRLEGQRERIARKVVGAYLKASNQPETRSDMDRIRVQTFRTLAVISPNDALGSIGSDIKDFDGLELTAVLDAVVQAARRPDAVFSRELCNCINSLYERHVRSDADSPNPAGILSRLLELNKL